MKPIEHLKLYYDGENFKILKEGQWPVMTDDYCRKCLGKGWRTGIERPCSCNPGGEWRSTKTVHEKYTASLQSAIERSVVVEIDERWHFMFNGWQPLVKGTIYTLPGDKYRVEFGYKWGTGENKHKQVARILPIESLSGKEEAASTPERSAAEYYTSQGFNMDSRLSPLTIIRLMEEYRSLSSNGEDKNELWFEAFTESPIRLHPKTEEYLQRHYTINRKQVKES
jgi:hypothetical protein